MSNRKIIEKVSDFGEKYYYTKHENGLEIYVIPKDFATSYATFATRYGAIDNCFRLDSEKGLHEVPDGIAHYLEHKMFENEDGVDTFSRFAKYGANANAFTSGSMTAYLFSCTDHLKENLEILLDYVSKPYFTPANVEKERGIIGQEIRMGEDNPGRALYYNLMGALYEKHQTRINVAGTVESIAKITPELLYDCYYTFYNFSNMTLCISGRTDMETVLEIVDRILPAREQKTIVRHYNEEKPEVNKARVVAEFEVSRPMFMIGVKDIDISSDNTVRMKKSIAMGILSDMLFGANSPFAVEVYESGLINGFHAGADHNHVDSTIMLSGETDDPEAVYQKFIECIEENRRNGLSRDEFERIKRSTYASFLKTFDSTRLADNYTFFIHDGVEPFAYANCLKAVTFEEVEALFEPLFHEEYYAMSVVNPIKK